MSIFRAGKNAIITGGASGIGLALAKKCFFSGMNVFVIDRNSDYLSKVKVIGATISTYNFDVANIDEWSKFQSEFFSKQEHVDLLCLNAGIGLNSTWDDTSYFRQVIDTNLFGVINGISTFIPSIRASSLPSSIVITGSKQGITNPPGNPAYNASKAAVKSIAEQLSFDLKDTQTSVHLLVPGWTFTGLSGGHPGSTKEKPSGAWTSEEVVEYLLEKIANKKFYVICPDNEVTEEMDKKRMLWGVGDIIEGREPLSRWRKEYKQEFEKF
ncbi:hypothetical protein HK096_008458 [Nowakowskiella sp. JEL0078]|nr:hypothetical protein HK096_008458 [Nowakowskiella sp. JEL0078]